MKTANRIPSTVVMFFFIGLSVVMTLALIPFSLKVEMAKITEAAQSLPDPTMATIVGYAFMSAVYAWVAHPIVIGLICGIKSIRNQDAASVAVRVINWIYLALCLGCIGYSVYKGIMFIMGAQ